MSIISVRVIKVDGDCPVFREGDKILIVGSEIDLDQSNAVCIHALPSILHYITALREGADAIKLGLSKEKGKAYINCPDPGEPYTKGGSVVFEISLETA
jgi:uncharacterized repeat protein (TIGR04076 family)